MTILREALRFYLQAQFALTPLALIYLFYPKGRVKLQLQWIIHRILLIGSLVLPLFFLLPMDRVVIGQVLFS